jgi:transposase
VKTPQDEIAALKDQLATNEVLTKGLLSHLNELKKQVEETKQENIELNKQVEKLTRKLNENSSNSNKPPSSDGLGERRKIRKPKKPTGRKQGAQKGHKGHFREMVPGDQVDRIIDLFPGPCEVCQKTPPQAVCLEPIRHQEIELLENGAPEMREYRRHEVLCDCGELLVAPDDAVPKSAFGPRLKSTICSLTGSYQLSRRQIPVLLWELFGIQISLGSVSNIEGQMRKALSTPSSEAMTAVGSTKIKHVDETSWVRDFERCSVWVFASAMLSVFRVVENGRRSTLLRLLGKKQRGILISDRASVFLFWSMKKRQVCWSHLLRAFIGFSQRDGPAGTIGADLVTCAELVLGYWRQYNRGAVSCERFKRWMEAVKRATKHLLEKAVDLDAPEFSGSCANMLVHWDAMWTYVDTPGVSPTNNHAERELRRLVLWRKRSFGTRSDRGDEFVERMLTVTHSLRKQSRAVIAYLHDCFVAMLEDAIPPSLIPASR